MTDFDRILCNFTIKESNTIRKLCEPLHQILGVQNFWYCETSLEGVHVSLSSNPEVQEYYHSSKFYLHNPFYRNPAFLQPGYYSYQAIDDEKFQDTIASSSSKLHLSFGGSFVIKSKSSIMCFGYAFDESVGRKSTDIILNNSLLLKKFHNYFLQETNTLLQKVRHDGVYLPNELGDYYNQRPMGLGNILTVQQKCLFLEKIGYLKVADALNLSLRELECLRYFHEGHSAKGTGKLLYISPRTVEKHLESIKNKLSCFTKNDLAHQAHMLHLAGFF